jgi:ABC-type multidrug transport system fused ATPase/permease subunit
MKHVFSLLFLFTVNLSLAHSNLKAFSSLYPIVITKLGSAKKISPFTKYIESLPPVERGKKKLKNKKKRRWKQKNQKKQQTQKKPLYLYLSVTVTTLFIIGILLFRFGFYNLPLLIIGLCLMAISNLIALVASFLSFPLRKFKFSAALAIFMVGLNFIVGVAFLIWGLIIITAFAWIMGLVLLGLALILLLLTIIMFNRVGK